MNYDALFLKIIRGMNDASDHGYSCCVIASEGIMMQITFGGRWEYELQAFSIIQNGDLMPSPTELPGGSIYKLAKTVAKSWNPQK